MKITKEAERLIEKAENTRELTRDIDRALYRVVAIDRKNNKIVYRWGDRKSITGHQLEKIRKGNFEVVDVPEPYAPYIPDRVANRARRIAEEMEDRLNPTIPSEFQTIKELALQKAFGKELIIAASRV